jgi:hypothetical protein
MTQYDDRVQYQRDLLKAEEWAKTSASIHVHSTDTMWYDNRPQDTKKGKSAVTDTIYNSGLVVRTRNGKHIHTFGERLTGEELVRSFIRHQS